MCGYVTKQKLNRRAAVGTAAQVRGYIELLDFSVMGGHSSWLLLAVSWAPRIRLSVVWYRAGWCIRPWPESDTARSSHPSSAFELSVLSLLLYIYTRPRGLYSCWPFSLLYTSNSSFWWCAAAAAGWCSGCKFNCRRMSRIHTAPPYVRNDI